MSIPLERVPRRGARVELQLEYQFRGVAPSRKTGLTDGQVKNIILFATRSRGIIMAIPASP